MKIEGLTPPANKQVRFAWSHIVIVPDEPGCYALVTFSGDVLYVGLATASIRNRMESHLDATVKRKGAAIGVPFWFHYLVGNANEVGAIERGWMNQAILEDGAMPPLNRIYSPIT